MNFIGDEQLQPKLMIGKLDLNVAQAESENFMSYSHTNVSQQKSFFKETKSLIFDPYEEKCDYHTIGSKPTAVNLPDANFRFADEKPSFFVKLGCIALTSLPKLMSASTEFRRSYIEYQIYRIRWTCYDSGLETRKFAIVFATVTNTKIVVTNTDFFAPCQNTHWRSNSYCNKHNICPSPDLCYYIISSF